MRMIPSILPTKMKSTAEKRVFFSFENVSASANARCFHSLRLSEHAYKREGEIDFLMVAPQGMYVFEVKGGRISRDNQGIWTYTDRFDVDHHNSEGPFKQAQSAIYSLRDALTEEFGEELIRPIPFGFGVLFPDCTFRVTSIEWPPEIILDADGFATANGFEQYLTQLIEYWQAKFRHVRPVSPMLVDRISQFLRPKFDRIPNLHNQAAQMDEQLESLTKEQYEKLDSAEDNDRILCYGGAGTGKTFIAAELARRHAAHGDLVLIVCRSPILAAYLRQRLDSRQIAVASIEQLEGNSRKTPTQYDVLIVDEAQDLMSYDHLGIMESYLKGGFPNGRWRFFLDANNQGAIYNSFDAETHEYLRNCNATILKLRRNCRNTKNIVTQTRLLTAADLGMPSAGDGPPVLYRYYKDMTMAAELLTREIVGLLSQDVNTGSISIISPNELSQSCAQLLPAQYRQLIVELSPSTVIHYPFKNITFSTISNYKGLENQFVIVADLAKVDLRDPVARSQLYVAMSRARTELVMIVHEDVQDDLRSVVFDTSGKLRSDLDAS